MFNLKKKNAVIIGAGGHLCSEMALSLADYGVNLALLDIRKEKIKILSDKIIKNKKNNNIKLINIKMNASKKNDHKKSLKKILKSFKKIDILINGAGINSSVNFFEISEKNWKDVIDSQLTATFFGCQVFGSHMVDNKKGVIINISSASAGPPLSKAFAYSASKSAIKNLTFNLAREWGEKGVRVNAIRPGFFPTQWNLKNFIDKKRKRQILSHTPMKRFGEPKELSSAIIWLCSDSSSFVTGTEVRVDGGFSGMSI